MYSISGPVIGYVTSAELQKYLSGIVDRQPNTMRHIQDIEHLEARGIAYSNHDHDVLSAAVQLAIENGFIEQRQIPVGRVVEWTGPSINGLTYCGEHFRIIKSYDTPHTFRNGVTITGAGIHAAVGENGKRQTIPASQVRPLPPSKCMCDVCSMPDCEFEHHIAATANA